MGLFNNLGKKFEQLKQEAEASASEEATHACRTCETLLYTNHDACPECDSQDVVALKRD